jgi:hypothetical protein
LRPDVEKPADFVDERPPAPRQRVAGRPIRIEPGKPSAYSPGAAFIVMLDDGCAFGGRDRIRKIRTQPPVTGAREVLVTELIVP